MKTSQQSQTQKLISPQKAQKHKMTAFAFLSFVPFVAEFQFLFFAWLWTIFAWQSRW